MPKLIKKLCIQCKDCDSFVSYKLRDIHEDKEYSLQYKKIFIRKYIICPSCGRKIVITEALVPVNLFSDEEVVCLYNGLEARKV